MSAAFAALGLFASWWVYTRTSNTELASGVFFYFTMELLQAIQYVFIASGLEDPICDTFMNRFLTLAGFLHICLQPYFCHVINASLTKSKTYRDKYVVIKRLCLLGGFSLFARYLLTLGPLGPIFNTMNLDPAAGGAPSTEWLRGTDLCTFKTKAMYHLGWSIPMADPTYMIPGAGIHSFLMFAPFLALYEKKGMVLQGAVLYFTGPGMAALITDNLMEQASIWCFFSIAQISIMLFLIREVLIVNWGRNESHSKSLFGGSQSNSSGKSKKKE